MTAARQFGAGKSLRAGLAVGSAIIVGLAVTSLPARAGDNWRRQQQSAPAPRVQTHPQNRPMSPNARPGMVGRPDMSRTNDMATGNFHRGGNGGGSSSNGDGGGGDGGGGGDNGGSDMSGQMDASNTGPAYGGTPSAQDSDMGAPPAASWYFCDAFQAYFPYVQSCPSGWRQVLAGAPSN
jgi:hypothetical protein